MEHHVIIIPGLGNEVKKYELAGQHWERFGVTSHVFDAKWKEDEPDFETKLNRALRFVDNLRSHEAQISIVGNSAGSSLALNIMAARKKYINAVVVNCGRIRRGDWPWFTFDQATAKSPSFKKSVLMAEKIERDFTNSDRNKILTIRPVFDEVVPPSTIPIKGASNIIIPSIEHVLSISLSMTLFKKIIIDFILRCRD